MAFKQSWSHVKRASEPTTFSGKYGLKRAAGLDSEGKECFVIPLDMASGYSCLPYHSLKKNDSEGFHGSPFASTKITCKRYDSETGEVSKELPLCCKLAQMEKDRLPETEDSSKRALSFTSFRYVFPVLVLSTTETDPNKKPTLKKLSLEGINFSFLDLAESTYEEELKTKVIEALVEAGTIEDPESMDPQELMEEVARYISHSIIKVSNVKSKTPAIPYQKSFRVVPTSNELIGATSGEQAAIKVLCKLLAGEYSLEQIDKAYKKYPNLQEINNQVIDFLQLFNDNVDSLSEDWTEDELKKYYDEFVARQAQIEKYKAVNETSEDDDDEEVVVRTNVAEDEDDDEDINFASSLEGDDELDSVEIDSTDDDSDIEDEIEEVPFDEIEEPVKPAKKATSKKAASKKVAVAAGSSDEFDLDDLEPASSSDDVELDESDFAMGDDDFEDLL